MNARHLRVIAYVVLALLLVWAATALLPRGTDRATTDFRLPAVASDSVDTITVTMRAETVRVARTAAGGWSVNGFVASRDAVDQLFDAIAHSPEPELVARSATSFVRLGLDTAAAHRLTVSGGGRTMLDLLVAERGPDAGGIYMRLPQDSAVYTSWNRLGSAVRRSVDDWRDRAIGSVVPDSVRRVEVERGARRYMLQRRDSVWILVGGPRPDSVAVRQLLDRFRTVNASAFPTPAQLDSAFRRRSERRVTLLGRGDSILLGLEFDSTAGGFWVRRSPEGPVYRVTTFDADQLAPADSTLRRRRP